MEEQEDLSYWLDRYRQGLLSDEEKLTLHTLLQDEHKLLQWNTLLEKVYESAAEQPGPFQDEPGADRMVRQILQHPDQADVLPLVPRRGSGWMKYAAAAAVVLLATGGYLLFRNEQRPAAGKLVSAMPAKAPDPESNQAVLTLANGEKVLLDSAGNSSLGMQGAARVTRAGAGSLVYSATGPEAATTYYNAVNTPAAKQFQVTLSDGTKVWLNASSSLKYPTSFPGAKRQVELTGEAYFEVAKNVSKPFIVQVNGSSVEVLGTHFNVMAYASEDELETTLLEGSVRFSKGSKSLLLKPGQQSKLSQDAEIQLISKANLRQVVAWKEGNFLFENCDIYEVMKQLQRWYGVRVEYPGRNINLHFEGVIAHSIPLPKVLEMLEKSGKIKLLLENGKIIVK